MARYGSHNKRLGDADRRILQDIIDHSSAYTPETVLRAKQILWSNNFQAFNSFKPQRNLTFLPSVGNATFYASQFRSTSAFQYHGVRYTPPAPTAPAPKTAPTTTTGPGFVLHKKNSSKYEGLDEIVAEATQQTAGPGWGDIGAETDLGGHVVGGADSYYEAPAPDNSDIGLPSKRRRIVKPVATSSAYKNETLFWRGMQAQMQKSLSIQNAQTQRMADSAATMAAGQRVRLGSYLGRYGSQAEREEILDALHIDNPSTRREALLLGEIEYARRNPYWKRIAEDHLSLKGGRLGWTDWERNADVRQNVGIPGRYRTGITKSRVWDDWSPRNVSGYDNNGFSREGDAATLFDAQAGMFAKGLTSADWKQVFKDFKNGLIGSTTVLKNLGGVAKAYREAVDNGMGLVLGAVDGLVPAPFRQGFKRLATGGLQAFDVSMQRFQYRATAASQGIGGLLGIGAGIFSGNPMAVIQGAGNVAQSIATWYVGKKQADLTDKASRINMWSGFAELYLAPLRMLGSAFRWLRGHVLSLGKVFLGTIAKFTQLGIPLTMLSSMSYADMQRSYVNDAMIGSRAGTTARTIEQFAGAQMDLYTFGKLDQERVIAAAMLGTFGSVYANGGNAKTQYNNTLNTIFKQLRGASPYEQERIMNLAGRIDSTMPTRLQQMKNLSLLDSRYEDAAYVGSSQWQRARGLTLYTATDRQRARYTQAGMEYTALVGSLSETRNAVAVRLWDTIGKPVMSGVNELFHSIAQGASGKEVWAQARKIAKDFWTNFTKEFGIGDISFGDAIHKAIAKIGELFWGIVPHVKGVILQIYDLITELWKAVIPTIVQTVGTVVDYLKSYRFDIDWVHKKIDVRSPESIERDYGAKYRDEARRVNASSIIKGKYRTLGEQHGWLTDNEAWQQDYAKLMEVAAYEHLGKIQDVLDDLLEGGKKYGTSYHYFGLDHLHKYDPELEGSGNILMQHRVLNGFTDMAAGERTAFEKALDILIEKGMKGLIELRITDDKGNTTSMATQVGERNSTALQIGGLTVTASQYVTAAETGVQ